MSEQVRRLTAFPRNDVIHEPAFTGKASELELLERFGPPTAVREEAFFEDPREFWDLEWSCGLIMAMEYHQLTEDLVVFLDAPDIDHALRHLGITIRELDVRFTERRDRFDRLTPRQNTWTIVAESADGERTVVARDLTQRDAACQRNELVANDLNVTYRIEPAGSQPQN